MALTTTASVKEYLGITGSSDDTLIGNLVSRAQNLIETYCDRAFDSASYRERYNGTGNNELALKQWPVTAVSYVSVGTVDAVQITNTSSDAYQAYITVDATNMSCGILGGTNAGTDALALSSYTVTTLAAAINALGKNWSAIVLTSDYGLWTATEILPSYGLGCLDEYCYAQIPEDSISDYKIYENRGIVYCPTVFPSGHQNIIVKYTAGYSSIPAELEQSCIDVVATWYTERTSANVKAERLGDHAITYDSPAKTLPSGIRQRLMPFKRTVI